MNSEKGRLGGDFEIWMILCLECMLVYFTVLPLLVENGFRLCLVPQSRIAKGTELATGEVEWSLRWVNRDDSEIVQSTIDIQAKAASGDLSAGQEIKEDSLETLSYDLPDSLKTKPIVFLKVAPPFDRILRGGDRIRLSKTNSFLMLTNNISESKIAEFLVSKTVESPKGDSVVGLICVSSNSISVTGTIGVDLIPVLMPRGPKTAR